MKRTLDSMWEAHRDHLRRVLIGQTRNIDLAEDLLQETYLRACGGIGGYRGGDARAWLVAIAKNVFYAHLRRKSSSCEEPFDADLHADGGLGVGSHDHLALLAIRQAVSDLSPPLRTAVIMKHYGGFSYKEIAGQLSCPEGTARRRVWTAIRQLRAALSEIDKGRIAMKCADLRGIQLLDYLYGAFPADKTAAAKIHLDECRTCREGAEEIKRIMRLLDADESDWKITKIVELDEHGVPYNYIWTSFINAYNRPKEIFWWDLFKDTVIDYVSYMGEEVVLEVKPHSNNTYRYEARLPKPVKPGGRVNEMMVFHNEDPRFYAKDLGDNLWRYSYKDSPNRTKEWVSALAIRLPNGAEFVAADPAPAETKTNGATTLVWRALLPIVERLPDGKYPWQFECAVEYRLDAPAAENCAKPSKKLPGCARWGAPPVAFKIHDLPWTGAGREALPLLVEAGNHQMDARTWFRLGLQLYDGEYYLEALEAFMHGREAGEENFIGYYCSILWQKGTSWISSATVRKPWLATETPWRFMPATV
jgi:RNA polymerase sigma-70 factor (ECF subfamily)